mgnify:FL=1
MRTRCWTALALTLLVASPASADRWTAIEQLPGAPTVRLLVRSKERIYFRVTAEKPLAFPVVGPAQVRLTTRVEMPAGSPAIATYQVKVSEGLRVVSQISTESSPAV